jgi:putative MATE family efflux protein
VGLPIQVILVVFSVLHTFVVGRSLIITRLRGATERWEANHILGQALMGGIVLSIVISLFWFFGATHIFKLIREVGTEAEKAGVTYLRTVAVFTPLIVTNFIALGIIRGSGDTHLSMVVNLLVNALNLLLAPTLIFGLFGLPRMEVQGAALAVGIAHSWGFLATMYVLRSRRSVLFLSFRELTTPNLKTFKRLFKAGVPTTVEQLVWAFGQLVVSGYAAVVGITFLAAHQVFLRIQAVLSMVYLGFGLGAMTLMGKNLGAKDRRRAEETAFMAGRVVLLFVFFITVAIWAFSKTFIAIFTSDPEVVAVGSVVIKIFALVQIPKAVDGVFMGNLRGAGDLRWLMWVTIISVLALEIGVNWVAVFILDLKLFGLWLIHGIDESMRLGLNYWRFKGGKWKFIDV